MRLPRILLATSALMISGLAAPALAQSPIGLASRSEPNVTGVLGARRVTLNTGASVHQNETVQTSAGGRTLLEFHDSTNLSVGPNASVKLDRYVYNSDETARQAAINMTRGAFRFVTGVSNPSAFTLRTPHATIGIRGTIVEFTIDATRTNINLRQGSISVCPRSGPQRECIVMNAGQQVSVTRAGVERPPGFPRGPDPGRSRDPGGAGGGDGGGGGGRGGK